MSNGSHTVGAQQARSDFILTITFPSPETVRTPGPGPSEACGSQKGGGWCSLSLCWPCRAGTCPLFSFQRVVAGPQEKERGSEVGERVLSGEWSVANSEPAGDREVSFPQC